MARLLPVAPTVGEIARRFDVPIHRVEYVIRSRAIQPTLRAGNIRVFSEAAADRIGAELLQIRGKRDADLLNHQEPHGEEGE